MDIKSIVLVEQESGNRGNVEIPGLGTVRVNRTHEGVIIDIWDVSEEGLIQTMAFEDGDFLSEEQLVEIYDYSEIDHIIETQANPDAAWENDHVQFTRLVAEIGTNVEISESDRKALCDSMDITDTELNQLFNRAQNHFEEIKGIE